MTLKMQNALLRLAAAGSLPKAEFHHSTVTALLKGGHVEELPGDSAWITLTAVKSEDLPQRDPEVPTVPIDDDVIASGVHASVLHDMTRTAFCAAGAHEGCYGMVGACSCECHQEIVSTVTPKAWIMGCSSCKMPMTADPHHLPGCEFLAAESVAEATGWVCRNRVKPSRVSRRRAQRRAMSR